MKEEENRTGTEHTVHGPEGESQGSDKEPSNRCRRDLDAVKSELDAFLYSVSHDLGAPLRAIQGFSLILLEKYSEALDDKGKDYLLRMQAASRKIDQMVNDLLQISRIAKAPLEITEVNLSEIAQGIADRLRKSAPDRRVDFILAENIYASGDQALLTLTLASLLDNAWKFTRKREQAIIEFGVLQEHERVYFVRDNGIGFPMARAAHRLFKPFQQLNKPLEYPGNGIGLAKVNRIIRRLGGNIWFESKEEEGATFFFTLG